MVAPAIRSLLFTPGNHPAKVVKVFTAGADVAILDLEDAVAVSEKAATRSPVVEALKQPRECLGYVRVNATDTDYYAEDIRAVVGPWLDGIVLPKVENADQLLAVDAELGKLEAASGVEPGAIDLIPILETAKGLAAVSDIAECGSRVRRLSFGAVDFAKDLGMKLSLDEWELTPARSEIVLASRVAELDAPLDSVWVHYQDNDGLVASATRVRDMGFRGKMCIHPAQIVPVNDVFTPSDEDVAQAEKIVAAFEEAEAQGSASIQVDGFFVDYPVVEQARRTLELTKQIRGEGDGL
ncbi:MAG: CoA ester lyase [Alphaproteobacteria bacterium]|jgi:citrate lyase subunit beta / citryl-CoA lyase|nr:CoA ester lyase [Alphaproteobacteria bacterium]